MKCKLYTKLIQKCLKLIVTTLAELWNCELGYEWILELKIHCKYSKVGHNLVPFNTFFFLWDFSRFICFARLNWGGKKATRPSPIHFLTDSQKIYDFCTEHTKHYGKMDTCLPLWNYQRKTSPWKGWNKILENFLIICLIYHPNHCHAYERQNIIRKVVAEVA